MSERYGPYVKVGSGRRIYLKDIRPEDWDLNDIAMSLSHLPRFSGNIGPYYVAQHCLHVADMARELGYSSKDQLKALLHEADEVVTGDIPSPVKWLEAEYIEMWSNVDGLTGFIKLLGRRLRDQGAFPAFGLEPGVPAWLKHLDNVAFATERRDFHFDDTVCMSHGEHSKDEVEPDSSRVLEFSDPHLAYQRFIRRARRLLQEVAFGR